MPKKHDWDKLKSEYVEGYTDPAGATVFPTLHDLGKRHGISESTIRKRSAQDDWATERDIYRQRIEQKRRENKADDLAAKASEFDQRIFQGAEIALKHITAHFAKANERASASRGADVMTLHQLEQLARALERYQKIGRLALGEATDIPGGDANAEQQKLIRELINDPEVAERIKGRFRSAVDDRTGEE